MCRHIGYIGKKNTLYSILLQHSHSLIELAYKPKEMREAILNADGYGIGWKNEKRFWLYKNDLPIWNDINLNSLSKSISSNLVIGNVRSATIAENLGYFNTHPFFHNNFCFSHNGYIKDFDILTKKKLLRYFDDKYLGAIKGNTDSELIFLLLLQYIERKKNIKKSIKEVIKIIEINYPAAMLNFLLAVYDNNGKNRLFATKYSKNLTSPSLYYLNNNKSIFISSEKLNNNNWSAIKDKSLIEVKDYSIKIEKI